MKYLIILLLAACTSQRTVMDSWLGQTKHSLILSWGPPVRTESDGADGEILVYSSASADYGTTYYLKMFYVKKDIIYHWVTRTSNVPPVQVEFVR